ncbi:2-hydroxychromene-2-carboxylate isomerase [Burkholderiales bacterium]|nr:2-hydroxychromene-2-carboxylate isomerase [Burkholderiales bacterium]
MSSPDDSARVTLVDVVSDVVCPWCYIGKRHLEAALAMVAEAGGDTPVVRWHPFELNPGIAGEGVDRREHIERKFGGPARAAQAYDRVRRAGTQAGIAFDFERIARQPNTRDAHRLIAWAQTRGDASALVERLFRAYFVDGLFVGSREVLADLAAEAGEDRDAARAFLDSGVGASEIEDAEARAASLGITGVPFFIVDGRYGLSGAQPAATIVEALSRARRAQAAD